MSCQVAEVDQVAEEEEGEEEAGGTGTGVDEIKINLSSKARRPCSTAITMMMVT